MENLSEILQSLEFWYSALQDKQLKKDIHCFHVKAQSNIIDLVLLKSLELKIKKELTKIIDRQTYHS